VKWLDSLLKIFPIVRDNIAYSKWYNTLDTVPLNGKHPTIPPIESRRLPLPSFFASSDWDSTSLTPMAEFEDQLRHGSASESLEEICQRLIQYNWNLAKKISDVHGQAGNTRFASQLRTMHSEAHQSACKYRVMYEGLLSLGLSQNDQMFRELLNFELWVKNTVQHKHLSSKIKEDPWYWRVPMLDGDENREAYVQEGIHLFLDFSLLSICSPSFEHFMFSSSASVRLMTDT
jgi:hypothetical protein